MPEPVLRKSPLTAVVSEVRFIASPLVNVVELANLLKAHGLTEYAAEEGLQLAMRPGQVEQRAVSRHRFATPDGSAAVTVDANTFAYETAVYAGIDAFLERWRPIAEAVGGVLGVEGRTRIG